MSDDISMDYPNAAISAAVLLADLGAFDFDDVGNPTGYSDAAVEFGRAYFNSLEDE